jgi:hypothetical protein
MAEWRHSSTVLNVSSRWRWVVSFIPLPLYRHRAIGTHWVGGLMGPEVSLDDVEKRKISCPWRWDWNVICIEYTVDKLDIVCHNWGVRFVYRHLCYISFDIGCDVLWETRQQRVWSAWNVLSWFCFMTLMLWGKSCEMLLLKGCRLESNCTC